MEFKNEITYYKYIDVVCIENIYDIFTCDECKSIMTKYVDYKFNNITSEQFVNFYNDICKMKNKLMRKNNKSISLILPLTIEPYIFTDDESDYYGYYDNILECYTKK